MALKRDDLKAVRQRQYLAKDFDSLRAQLLEYARLYYPDKIADFSESSVGGLLLDFAAYTGDVLSFYLDHQYSELNPETAVETPNIERALRNALVPIVGTAPSLVPITVFVQVPAENVNNTIGPAISALPTIQASSIFNADNGTDFILLEDIDFNKKLSSGQYMFEVKVGQKSPKGSPLTYIITLSGLCISGKEKSESISIGKDFVPFRKVMLSNANVSDIVSVYDGFGNIYYQVASLDNDVVYRNVLNTAKDNAIVKDSIKIVPAPFRYTSNVDLTTRRTTLTFGSGNANTLEDDIIPDPSDFAISFPYSKTFSRIAINPQQLLQTKTLGTAATDTTLTITYRHGGGLNNNVSKDSIRTIKTLKIFFPGNPSAALAANVKGNIEVTNRIDASGGEDAPTADDLKALIPSIKNSQERIVTREDLLSRVYTLPSNFGRVFRASVGSNPNNPLATQLFIVSRNQDLKLIISPDTLKQNLKTYLNPYRMISDAIDVLDARILNLTVNFSILIDPALNRSTVLLSILTKLQTFFDVKNFHIDQPIIMSDVVNTIFTVPGIISVNDLKFNNIVGTVNNRIYSDETFDVSANTRQGIIFPPLGSIFEIRYPEYDVIGKAVA
jgi:hypothetical protein